MSSLMSSSWGILWWLGRVWVWRLRFNAPGDMLCYALKFPLRAIV